MGIRFPGGSTREYGANLATYLERGLLFALPGFAALTMAMAVLVLGRPRPVPAIRVLGGPAVGAGRLSFRVEGVEEGSSGVRVLAGKRIHVDVLVGARSVHRFDGVLDDEGAAHVAALLPGAPGSDGVVVVVGLDGSAAPVAHEPVRVSATEWGGTASRRGGWVSRPAEGKLAVRAAAGRGVFAVPFSDSLLVEVQREGGPLRGASVRVRAEGAEVSPGAVVTDLDGRARVMLTPTEHTVALSIEAVAPDGDVARLELTPAVIPGALHAVLAGSELVIRAPVAKERAYVALVGEGQRFLGATVRLADDGRGGAVGSLPLPSLPGEPVWAVVSSESDLRSPALVGWPIGDAAGAPPRATFDAADVVWFDTRAQALARESERVGQLRVVLAAIVCAALALSALLVVRRSRAAGAELGAHLASLGEDPGRDRQGGLGVAAAVVSLLLAGLLCIAFVLAQ